MPSGPVPCVAAAGSVKQRVDAEKAQNEKLNQKILTIALIMSKAAERMIAPLTTVELAAEGIVDVAPFSVLTSLTELDLSENEIVDVSPLSSLTSLFRLDFRMNQIVDVSPLSSLMSISQCWCRERGVSNRL